MTKTNKVKRICEADALAIVEEKTGNRLVHKLASEGKLWEHPELATKEILCVRNKNGDNALRKSRNKFCAIPEEFMCVEALIQKNEAGKNSVKRFLLEMIVAKRIKEIPKEMWEEKILSKIEEEETPLCYLARKGVFFEIPKNRRKKLLQQIGVSPSALQIITVIEKDYYLKAKEKIQEEIQRISRKEASRNLKELKIIISNTKNDIKRKTLGLYEEAKKYLELTKEKEILYDL